MAPVENRKSKIQNRPAFTLIELLVVVAIVALLIAILLPNLSSARRRARATVCAANLHGLGIGLATYLDANGGLYPRYYTNSLAGDPLGVGRLWWFGFEPNGPGTTANRPLDKALSPLAPYTVNLDVRLQCPDFPYDDASFFPKFNQRAASYGYNLNLGPTQMSLTTSRNRFADRLSGIVAFADAVHFEIPPPSARFNEAHYLQFIPNCSQPSGYAHFRHNNEAQYLLLDGHVEAQRAPAAPHYTPVDGSATGNLASTDGGGLNSSAIYGN